MNEVVDVESGEQWQKKVETASGMTSNYNRKGLEHDAKREKFRSPSTELKKQQSRIVANVKTLLLRSTIILPPSFIAPFLFIF